MKGGWAMRSKIKKLGTSSSEEGRIWTSFTEEIRAFQRQILLSNRNKELEGENK